MSERSESPAPSASPATAETATDLGPPPSGRYLHGRAEIRRIGRWRFPALELVQGDTALARMGRLGWTGIVFGRGVRIELADGTGWRLRSAPTGGVVCPIVIDSDGRRIAISGLGTGTYGITGRDYACVLYPADKPRIGRSNRWILRQHEEELATITRNPLVVQADRPVHLGAVLLSFVLARHGVFGETAPRVPLLRWS